MARRFRLTKKRGTPRASRLLRSETLERREVLSAAGLGAGVQAAMGGAVQANAGNCDTVQVASQDCDQTQLRDQSGQNAGGPAAQMRQQRMQSQQQQQQDCTLVGSSLSDEQAATLLYMRQEEKLARDVYQAMDTLYGDEGVTVFANIAASEQQHMDAIGKLIDKYGLDYPVGDSEPGVFEAPQLQQLYNNLIAQGSTSLAEAYQVGIDIEVADIADLQTALDSPVNVDVGQVYSHLLAGSQHHLASITAASEGSLTCPTYSGTGGSQAGSGTVNGQGSQTGDRLQSQLQDQQQTNLQQCDEQDPAEQQTRDRDRAFEELGAAQVDRTQTQRRDSADSTVVDLRQRHLLRRR